MQNSELFRRGIVVPIDQEAEESLRVNNVSRATNVRYLAIADEDEFDTLWRIGLFREINSRCASLLDDYEEEMLEAPAAAGILAAMESVASNIAAQHPEMIRFLKDAQILVNEATRLSRPILFVL